MKYLSPVKLNMTVMKGLNDGEIWDMVNFAAKTGTILQLIELEAPREMTETPFFRKYFYPLKPVEEKLEKLAVETRERRMHRRKKYFIPTEYGIAEVEVVRAMHNTVFCANCTRLRVTSNGKFKTCLLRNNDLIDFVSTMRKGGLATMK